MIYKEVLEGIYESLFDYFGPQNWWPAETRFEVIVGAILTQSTTWHNVEKAIANLKSVGILHFKGLLNTPEKDIAELIRPSGYYNMKARKLKRIIEYLAHVCGGNLEEFFKRPLPELRNELLKVYGVGPETADSILLYAGERASFVIDAYTRRIFRRLNIIPAEWDYEESRNFFIENLPASVQLFNEYHALIVALGKEFCVARNPKCEGCPLQYICTCTV